jgi:hypothetical protein
LLKFENILFAVYKPQCLSLREDDPDIARM